MSKLAWSVTLCQINLSTGASWCAEICLWLYSLYWELFFKHVLWLFIYLWFNSVNQFHLLKVLTSSYSFSSMQHAAHAGCGGHFTFFVFVFIYLFIVDTCAVYSYFYLLFLYFSLCMFKIEIFHFYRISSGSCGSYNSFCNWHQAQVTRRSSLINKLRLIDPLGLETVSKPPFCSHLPVNFQFPVIALWIRDLLFVSLHCSEFEARWCCHMAGYNPHCAPLWAEVTRMPLLWKMCHACLMPCFKLHNNAGS